MTVAPRLTRRKEEFARLVTEGVEALGAKPADDYAYSIWTSAGRLRISPFDGWVACRFDDIERACEVFGCDTGRPYHQHILGASFNTYSGKWNHHYTKFRNLQEAQEAAEDFVAILRRVAVMEDA